MDFIEMEHPNLPANPPVSVAPDAFEKVWKEKGWRRVGEAVEETASAPKRKWFASEPELPADEENGSEANEEDD